jgi:hypothetical protein
VRAARARISVVEHLLTSREMTGQTVDSHKLRDIYHFLMNNDWTKVSTIVVLLLDTAFVSFFM